MRRGESLRFEVRIVETLYVSVYYMLSGKMSCMCNLLYIFIYKLLVVNGLKTKSLSHKRWMVIAAKRYIYIYIGFDLIMVLECSLVTLVWDKLWK